MPQPPADFEARVLDACSQQQNQSAAIYHSCTSSGPTRSWSCPRGGTDRTPHDKRLYLSGAFAHASAPSDGCHGGMASPLNLGPEAWHDATPGDWTKRAAELLDTTDPLLRGYCPTSRLCPWQAGGREPARRCRPEGHQRDCGPLSRRSRRLRSRSARIKNRDTTIARTTARHATQIKGSHVQARWPLSISNHCIYPFTRSWLLRPEDNSWLHVTSKGQALISARRRAFRVVKTGNAIVTLPACTRQTRHEPGRRRHMSTQLAPASLMSCRVPSRSRLVTDFSPLLILPFAWRLAFARSFDSTWTEAKPHSTKLRTARCRTFTYQSVGGGVCGCALATSQRDGSRTTRTRTNMLVLGWMPRWRALSTQRTCPTHGLARSTTL